MKSKIKQTPVRLFLGNLRKEHGETIVDMTRKLSCSKQYINFVENGRKKASESFLRKVVEEYHLSREQEEALRFAAWASSDVCLLDISHLSYDERTQLCRHIAAGL